MLWRYAEEVTARYLGYPVSAGAIQAVLDQNGSEDLAPPGGLFLLARQGEAVVGCVGMRWALSGTGQHLGEVQHLFVVPAARGQGVATRLLGEVERAAAARGVHQLRLHTRTVLREVRTRLLASGYREVAEVRTDPYAEHWFTKTLP